MPTLVVLGGGEIGRPGYPVETTKIDQELVRLTGKKRPKVLFLPTASGDSEGYIGVVRQHFGKRLGCSVEALKILSGECTKKELREKILGADIIYVGGGNTKKMLAAWKTHGVDKLLKEAHAKGVILSGLSAGGLCWFRHGVSDWRKMLYGKDAPYAKLSGLNIIPALHCPHMYREPDRKADLRRMMRTTPGIAIAIDDCAAISIIDDTYRVLASKPGRHAYKCYWSRGEYHEELLKPSARYSPLKDLLTK
jgi:dipeptidase E